MSIPVVVQRNQQGEEHELPIMDFITEQEETWDHAFWLNQLPERERIRRTVARMMQAERERMKRL